MLHIILFILKFIGWVVLFILGLLVLLFLAVLFTPLRYQAETSCRGKLSTFEAGVNFRIFFRLVSGSLRYQDGNLSWNVRAAWIKLGNKAEAEDVEEKIEEAGKDFEEAVENRLESHTEELEAGEERGQTKPAKQPEVFEKKRIERSIEESGEAEADEKSAEAPADRGKPAEGPAEEGKSAEAPADREETIEDPAGGREETKGGTAKETLTDKIAAVFQKIKYTFDKICDKIRRLLEKAESVKAFLTDEVHQSAFLKCLAELKKMGIRLRPKRIAGEVRFGFEDPSLTGRVLAGVSMLYPYWGEYICCYPDFEHKVLEGELSVKGSLRLLPAAILGWNLLWNKNVRRTVMDVKRFISK